MSLVDFCAHQIEHKYVTTGYKNQPVAELYGNSRTHAIRVEGPVESGLLDYAREALLTGIAQVARIRDKYKVEGHIRKPLCGSVPDHSTLKALLARLVCQVGIHDHAVDDSSDRRQSL
ncbi:hypothetical protein PG994_013841 [Apiospora phragmitis]|uniref:Uncharacterized protein n=1 Tax=Apiospora phragmitis TaxID=2905665 RepID=A0ABR1T4M6_9PEZI